MTNGDVGGITELGIAIVPQRVPRVLPLPRGPRQSPNVSTFLLEAIV